MTTVGAQETQLSAGVRRARWWHLATFIAALWGVAVQVWIEVDPAPNPDRPEFSTVIRLWNVVSYFTVWSNILVLAVAFLLWRDAARTGWWFVVFQHASLAMITVTGVVYAWLLAPLWDPTGWQRVADETLHYTVPFLAVVSYLVVGPRPRFTTRTLWAMLAIPLTYIVYTLIRSPFIDYSQDGETRHWYPYHFVDVNDLGYGRALINSLAVLLLLLGVGALYLLADRKLPPKPVVEPSRGTRDRGNFVSLFRPKLPRGAVDRRLAAGVQAVSSVIRWTTASCGSPGCGPIDPRSRRQRNLTTIGGRSCHGSSARPPGLKANARSPQPPSDRWEDARRRASDRGDAAQKPGAARRHNRWSWR